MAARISHESSPRVVTAAVTSVTERRAEKKGKVHYVFQLEAEWSDGSKTTRCRGYQEFFELQCKLLDTFAEEAGSVKGSQRILPFLPGKQMFRRSTKQLALERQPELDRYIQELIGLPEHISQYSYVKQFLGKEQNEETVQYLKEKDSDQDQSKEDADEAGEIDGFNGEHTS